MRKPRRPTAIAMTMCRMRGMMAGEACKNWRWVSRVTKKVSGGGVTVHRSG